MNNIDPKIYGLNSRVKLESIDTKHLAIAIHRKSRIIMKDGQRILEMVEKIKSTDKQLKVSLSITGPICSKTTKLMKDEGVDLIVKE